MDEVKEDMKRAGVAEEDGWDRMRWNQTISCGDPLKGAAKRRRGLSTLPPVTVICFPTLN